VSANVNTQCISLLGVYALALGWSSKFCCFLFNFKVLIAVYCPYSQIPELIHLWKD